MPRSERDVTYGGSNPAQLLDGDAAAEDSAP